jgi:hypothetical protein
MGHLLTKLDETLPHFLDISRLILVLRESPHQLGSLGLENRDTPPQLGGACCPQS